MIIQQTVDGSPYGVNDLIKIAGGPDGTTAWVEKGGMVEVVFANDTHAFVGLRQPPSVGNEHLECGDEELGPK